MPAGKIPLLLKLKLNMKWNNLGDPFNAKNCRSYIGYMK